MNAAKHGQSLRFQFSDDLGDILTIDVPFTLQKNGAWFLPKSGAYEGYKYHKKEKTNLLWGQRRPKKSKEIATSINTYMLLGKALS